MIYSSQLAKLSKLAEYLEINVYSMPNSKTEIRGRKDECLVLDYYPTETQEKELFCLLIEEIEYQRLSYCVQGRAISF